MTHIMVGPDLTPKLCACDSEIDHGLPLGPQAHDGPHDPEEGGFVGGAWRSCGCAGCRDYNHELEEW